MSYSVVRLYVKSMKTLTHVSETVFNEPRTYRGARMPTYTRVVREPEFDYVLPENHQKIVETVERIARAYGLKVEVLDVTRENVLRRVLQEGQERIKAFPTLVAGLEQRLEGEITEEQVKSLFLKIAERTRKKYV